MRSPFLGLRLFLVFIALGLASRRAHCFDTTKIDFTQFKEDAYFQKLMHYEPSILGFFVGQKLKGQADGPEFYFSKDGKWNLAAEAQASTEAFLSGPTKDPNLHPQCRFPERYRYVKEKLKLEVADQPCPDFQEWIHDLDPIGVAIVFAANFPNNPASAMGHTFMRVISRKTARGQRGSEEMQHMDLLDYSISYAAVTDVDGGIKFALKGLLGGFIGEFTMQPYYMKVREYNEGEGRDLWEYELNIDEASARRMMSHFWEIIKNTYFYYFFIDENCSFHLLTLLDVAKPEWNLTHNFLLYTVPFETIKVVSEIPGAVIEKKYRAALPKRLRFLISQLDQSEQVAFSSVISGNVPLEKFANNPLFLEAVTQYILYQKIGNKMKFKQGHEELYRRALIARAKLGKSPESKKIRIPIHESPDLGHGTSKIMLSAGVIDNRELEILSFRPALHDLLNKDAGFSSFSRFNVLQIQAHRYEKQKSTYEYKIRELTFFDSLSLVPVTPYEKPLSWGIRMAFQRPVDMIDRTTLQFLPSAGYAFSFFDDTSMLYTLLEWNFEHATFAKNNFRTGPWAAIGSVSNLNYKAKLHLEITLMSDLIGADKMSWSLWSQVEFSYYLSRDLDLRLLCQRFQRIQNTRPNYFQNQIALGLTF